MQMVALTNPAVGLIILGGIAVYYATDATLEWWKQYASQSKAAQKVMEEQVQKCQYCGNIKTSKIDFWELLPNKSGKYRSNGGFCYYKDMKWDGGKRLECFKRTGHACPHQGQACTKCGTMVGKAKAHEHPADCPYK